MFVFEKSNGYDFKMQLSCYMILVEYVLYKLRNNYSFVCGCLFIFFVILNFLLSKAKRYLYCHRRSNYQEGELEGWDLINRLSRHTFAPVPSQDWISNVIFRCLV